MSYDVVISFASGFGNMDACAIALRSMKDMPYRPGEGDSWALWAGKGLFITLGGHGDWLTGCWYSPNKRAWFCSAAGRVTTYWNMEAGFGNVQWSETMLGASLFGIWGFSDEHILAWGERAGQGVMFRWDGQAWSEVAPPGGMVIGLHGKRPDLIVAVGKGLISRWDGQRWNAVEVPSGLVLNAVWVEGEDEMYACGPSGILMEGSVHGWAQRLQAPHGLFGVAKFKGDIWLGCGDAGVGKLQGQAVQIIKPNIPGFPMDAREALLITAQRILAHTADGASFSGTMKEAVADVHGKQPLW